MMPEDYEEFISFDPEDNEIKETEKNARKKLETPVAPAMPCKTCKESKNGETRSTTNDFKSKFAGILEASESTTIIQIKYIDTKKRTRRHFNQRKFHT